MISVCLASHNGALYLAEQIASILEQLSLADELIIVDDCSTDNTLDVIQAFDDERIQIYGNTSQLGHVKSFAKAIARAKGDIVFLSDQDDIWPPGRVKTMVNAMNTQGVAVIAANFHRIDKAGQTLAAPSVQLRSADSTKYLTNILGIFLGRRPYYGCTMAFRGHFRDQLLPIPGFVESHDLWIALAANLESEIHHLEDSVLQKRTHANNVSSRQRRALPIVFISRLRLLASVFILLWRAWQPKKDNGK